MEPQHFRPSVGDASDFRAAVIRAEEAAGITRDDQGAEAAGETPEVTPELPEAVPVQASDQPLETEPAETADTSEQEPAAQAAPAEPQTLEELQAELARTQARLEEKDTFIGRQSGEVGELRGMVDELKARLDAQAVQPATPQAAAPQIVITQELIDSNPAQAVQVALEQKNEQALAVAFEAWREVDEFSAGQWLAEKRSEQREAALRSEIEATRAELRNVAEPLAETAEAAAVDAAWGEAFTTVMRAHPDFLTVDEQTGKTNAERLLEEGKDKFPHLVSVLSTADAAGKAEVLMALYNLDRAQSADPAQVREELERQAVEAAEEAEAARHGAHVVTQATVGQPGVEKTSEELEQEGYISRMGAKPSLERGWTGRT